MEIIDEMTKQVEKKFYYLDYYSIMGTLGGQHMVVCLHATTAYHSKMIYDGHKICRLVPDLSMAHFIHKKLHNINYFAYLFCFSAELCAIMHCKSL